MPFFDVEIHGRLSHRLTDDPRLHRLDSPVRAADLRAAKKINYIGAEPPPRVMRLSFFSVDYWSKQILRRFKFAIG
jgi:hypothetical protein